MEGAGDESNLDREIRGRRLRWHGDGGEVR